MKTTRKALEIEKFPHFCLAGDLGRREIAQAVVYADFEHAAEELKFRETVVGRDPHTPLELIETHAAQLAPERVARFALALRDVVDDHAPLAIPSCRPLERHRVQIVLSDELLAAVRKLDPYLPALDMRETNELAPLELAQFTSARFARFLYGVNEPPRAYARGIPVETDSADAICPASSRP